ncbi:hypothetical protein [Microbacterium sp. R86528]|uniref:hypothetical protein n=1 Tax=Microbacterium sp. R86528 TaxID=3093864 RepID=UPI0037C9ECCF
MTSRIPDAVRLYARAQTDRSARPTASLRELYDAAAEWTLHARVPSAQHVAEYLVARHLTDVGPAFRGETGLVIRRDGALVHLPAVELRGIVADLLGALPERVTGLREHGRADVYRGLRDFLRLADEAEVAEYLGAVTAAVGPALKPAPVAKPKRERPAPKSTAERVSAHRVRRAEWERETVTAFLADRITWGDAEPIVRTDLLTELAEFTEAALDAYESEREALQARRDARDMELDAYETELQRWRDERDFGDGFLAPRPERPDLDAPVDEWPEVAEEEGYPLRPVEVGRNRALALFAELGVDTHRTREGRFHILPESIRTAPREDTAAMQETSEVIRDRADAYREEADAMAYRNTETERELDLFERRLALLRSGDRVGALTLQRETLAATGTEGRVIDAADRFRRKATP